MNNIHDNLAKNISIQREVVSVYLVRTMDVTLVIAIVKTNCHGHFRKSTLLVTFLRKLKKNNSKNFGKNTGKLSFEVNRFLYLIH